jgi:DNA-binding response OmpR family regulator
MRVLILENEARIAAGIAQTLTRAGYVVERVGDGEKALFQGDAEAFDAIVLDLGRPMLDGLCTGHASAVLEAGPIRIDTRRLNVTVAGRPTELTPLEFRLLRYLVHHKGRPFSQVELEDHVYCSEQEPESNAMEALIHRLRRKIGNDLIVTKRGHGYMVEDRA